MAQADALGSLIGEKIHSLAAMKDQMKLNTGSGFVALLHYLTQSSLSGNCE